MANATNIPAPRVPLIDQRTGLMTREWFRYFQNLFTLTGADGSTASIQDLELSATGLSSDSLTEMQKALQDLELSILPLTATSTGGTTYSVFTSTTNGLAPASGGGSTNFLRADGTWAVPPGTGGGITDGDKGDIVVSGGATVWTIDTGVVTNAKLANVSTATFKGRTTAGTGSPEDLTGTQATALLDTFTTSLKGLAPASGGGTTNFLRADGTWAAPGGGGGTTVNTGSATLDFGAAPGSNEAFVAVTGLTTILATSKVQAWIMGGDTSVDHTASDHRYFPVFAGVTCGTPTAATGFTLYGRSTQKLTGKWTVRYLWVD